jgi:hypothetical protein
LVLSSLSLLPLKFVVFLSVAIGWWRRMMSEEFSSDVLMEVLPVLQGIRLLLVWLLLVLQ